MPLLVPSSVSDAAREQTRAHRRELAPTRAERSLDVAEKWQEEASLQALAGNPARARFIEDWIARLGIGWIREGKAAA